MTEPHLHLSGRVGNQDREEFIRFLALILRLGIKRYLEVGCRNGDSWYDIALAMGEGSYAAAIDLGEFEETRQNLTAAQFALRHRWIGADVIFGRSEDPATVQQAVQWGTFDLILIDADHSLQGVRRDWLNYRYSAPIIAFHDIAAPPGHEGDGKPVEVPILWAELKAQYRHEEIINPGSNMGFGILYTDGRIR